jgi:hypothetical protein
MALEDVTYPLALAESVPAQLHKPEGVPDAGVEQRLSQLGSPLRGLMPAVKWSLVANFAWRRPFTHQFNSSFTNA